MKRGLERWYRYKEVFSGALSAEEAKGEQANPVQLAFLKIVVDHVDRIIGCVESGKPLASIWYGNAPEIFAALGIDWYCPVDMVLASQAFTSDLAEVHTSSTPDDSCGLIQLAAQAVEKGYVPTPNSIIAMLEPCDAQTSVHDAWLSVDAWSDIPTFALDYPYGSTQGDFKYFADELGRMIAFLEDLYGVKMDWDRLREVCETSNQMYAAWSDLNDLLCAVPCPLPPMISAELGWNVTQHLLPPGSPDAINLFNLLSAGARQAVEAGIGAVPHEQVRILWADLDGTWAASMLAPWLAEKYGAVIVQTFQGHTPYLPIDTSSPESMLLGVGRRSISEVPMIRQARGSVGVFIEDIKSMVNDYTIDMVFFPGHKGHKDQSANIGFLRETCHDIEVPLFAFTCDLFDPTWVPIDQLKRSIDEFFETQEIRPLG